MASRYMTRREAIELATRHAEQRGRAVSVYVTDTGPYIVTRAADVLPGSEHITTIAPKRRGVFAP